MPRQIPKKLKKPAHPGRYKRDKSFPRRTPWNPRLPVSAVSNRPPDALWPIKEGTAVFAIDGLGIVAGHVTWWHPARKIDASSIVSVGKPFFRVATTGGRKTCVRHVFPYTAAGWKAARTALAGLLEKEAKDTWQQANLLYVRALELDSLASEVTP